MALLEIHLQVLRSHLVISTRVAVPKLLFLCSRICCRDVGPNGPNNKHSLEENLWHVASTTSTVASLRVARLRWRPRQAKLSLFMKCQINSQIFSNTNLDRLGKTGRYQQLPSCTFFALHDLYPGSCPKVVILTQLPFAVEMWAQMGQITKHSLKEHLWHVASTTSTVASLRVARLRWLPRQAKLSLHDGWQRTRKLCHCSWNVKSIIS